MLLPIPQPMPMRSKPVTEPEVPSSSGRRTSSIGQASSPPVRNRFHRFGLGCASKGENTWEGGGRGPGKTNSLGAAVCTTMPMLLLVLLLLMLLMLLLLLLMMMLMLMMLMLLLLMLMMWMMLIQTIRTSTMRVTHNFAVMTVERQRLRVVFVRYFTTSTFYFIIKQAVTTRHSTPILSRFVAVTMARQFPIAQHSSFMAKCPRRFHIPCTQKTQAVILQQRTREYQNKR